jgi:16S rRNA (guanine527-N7)-methyltransferase
MINIVSTRGVDNLLTRLIRQSVEPLSKVEVPVGAVVLDVGSGAGLPGLPLKFARPDLKLTLLEARRKKAAFLRRAVKELDLQDVAVVHGRLEEFCREEKYARSFQLVTTRGTGSAAVLYPLMAPLVAEEGQIWFYKGSNVRRERDALEKVTDNSLNIIKIYGKMSVIVLDMRKPE